MDFEEQKMGNEQIKETIEAIVTKSNPTKSGVLFYVGKSYKGEFQFSADSPLQTVTESDDQLLDWYKKLVHFHKKADYEKHEEYRQRLIKDARYTKAREFTGGYGITKRSIDVLQQELPGVEQMLAKAQGKILFLGNGLSEVPLIISSRYGKGKFREPPIIVDMFNYFLLDRDLELLSETIKQKGLPPLDRLVQSKQSTARLCEAIQKGSLKAVNYYFGQGNPPDSLVGAQLIINSYGPPSNTMGEQIGLLKIGGQLYTTYDKYDPPSGFNKQIIPSPDPNHPRLVAACITRLE